MCLKCQLLRNCLPSSQTRLQVSVCFNDFRSKLFVLCCLFIYLFIFVLFFFLQDSFVEEALAQMEGSTLADMFDFLSKELIRLQVRNTSNNRK